MDSWMSDFKRALDAWVDAWSFIFKHQLSHYFLYPIMLSIVLSMGVLALVWTFSMQLGDFIGSYFDYQPLEGSWWEMTKAFFGNVAQYAASGIILLFVLYIYRRLHKYIVLACMSPVMSLLSERTSEIITGGKIPLDGQQWVRDIFRGLAISLRNLIIEQAIGIGLWILPLVLTLFTFGIGSILTPIIGVLGVLVSAYFYGFSTMDYTNERRRKSIPASILYIKTNKGLAVGNGLIFYALMAVPFVGMPIAVVTCTVASTIAIYRKEGVKC